MTKPNCYDCIHRRTIPGNTHSRCVAGSGSDPMSEIASLLGARGAGLPATTKAGAPKVTGDAYGIRSGWFQWPHNFDPTWLRSCDSFRPKGAKP